MVKKSGSRRRQPSQRYQLIIPAISTLLSEKVDIDRLKKVEIEDLLVREPLKPDNASSNDVTGKVVLVSGAGGSIGS